MHAYIHADESHDDPVDEDDSAPFHSSATVASCPDMSEGFPPSNPLDVLLSAAALAERGLVDANEEEQQTKRVLEISRKEFDATQSQSQVCRGVCTYACIVCMYFLDVPVCMYVCL